MKKLLIALTAIAITFTFAGCEADFSSDSISDDPMTDGADLLGNRHIGQSGEPVVLVQATQVTGTEQLAI